MRVNCLGSAKFVFLTGYFLQIRLTLTNELVENNRPVLAQPDALPGPEGHPPVADGKGEVGAEEAGLGVGRHVVRALAAVLERDRLRD